jgi:hydrogenase nickel incorporation protein HypB
MKVKVLQNILDANNQIANRNREMLDKAGVLAINVMSSPGAGKTSLLMQTITRLKDRVKIAVIEGDIASTIDADRISQTGVPALQINTGGSCHLDANMINNALENMSLKGLDLLFIENVGNLVCPAEFKLGSHKQMMLLSTPEGDDKPYKYPLMFTESELIILNKIDLLPYLDFNVKNFEKAVRGLNRDVKIFPLSCKTGEGFDAWISWLEAALKGR